MADRDVAWSVVEMNNQNIPIHDICARMRMTREELTELVERFGYHLGPKSLAFVRKRRKRRNRRRNSPVRTGRDMAMEALAMRNDGKSMDEIGEHLELSVPDIVSICRNNNITLNLTSDQT